MEQDPIRPRTLLPDDLDPGFVLRDPSGSVLMHFPPPAPPQPIKEQEPGTFESALKRGSLGTASDFATTGGLIAEWLGSDEYSSSFYAKADEYARRAEAYKPTIGSIENAETIGDYATFAFEVLVENAPMLASMAVPGGAVAKGAQLAGAGVKAASAAGTAAAFMSNVGLQTGESGSIAREAGESPVDARVVGSGLGKALLDFVPLLALAKRFGLAKGVPLPAMLERAFFQGAAERGFIRRAAGHSAAIAAQEMPTEVAQELINISLDRALRDLSGAFTEEEISQMKNAAAGAAAFGLLGIPAGLRKPVPDVRDDDATPPGVDIQVEGEQKLLEGPEGPGTGIERVVLEGEFIPADRGNGDASFDPNAFVQIAGEDIIPKLPKLDEEVAEPEQRQAAQQAISPEVERTTDRVFYVDGDGAVTTSQPTDPMLEREFQETDPVSQGLNLTAEQLEVAAAFPEYLMVTPTSPEGQNIAGLHPGLQRLFDIRSDLVSDADNYRTTDGLLKKATEKKIDTVDKKIETLQKRLGIDPASYITREASAENLQDQSGLEQAAAPQLSVAQKAQMERLSEKEQEQGLTDAEMDTFVGLQQIATGEISEAATKPQTQEEISELDDLATSAQRDETTAEDDSLAAHHQRRERPYKIGIAGTGIDIETAQNWLSRFANKLQFGPKIVLVSQKSGIARQKAAHFGREVQGWWDPNDAGSVFIVADNHHSVEDLFRTYLHETLAHFGLRSILTAQQFNSMLRSMIKNPPEGFNARELEKAMEEGDVQMYVEAEEYIAHYAENLIFDPQEGMVQQAWWQRLLALVRQALRKLNPGMKWTNNDLHHLLRNVSRGLSGRIPLRNKPGEGGYFNPDIMASFLGDKVKGAKVSHGIRNLGGVWGARWAKMFLTPLQFASKYQVEGSNQFLDIVQQWWARKRDLTDDAAVVGDKWMKLGKKDQMKLAEATLEMSIRSDEFERKLTEAEIKQAFKDLGMADSPALQTLWREMDATFQDMVTQLRGGLEKIAIRTQGKAAGERISREEATQRWKAYKKAMQGTAKDRQKIMNRLGISTWLRLQDINEEMSQLENRNYFPRMRFGSHGITIRAKKDMMYKGKSFKGPTDGKRGEVLYFEAFETDRAAQQAFGDLAKEFGKNSFEMQISELQDQETHFMGVMSPQLYEQLMGSIPKPKNESEQAMNEQMKETLKEIYLQQAPGRSFLRHLTKRKGIEGYSQDVIRVYSSYMMNIANHISRLDYHIDMNEQLQVIDAAAKNTVPDARIEGIVRNYFGDQYDYLMNPENDLAQLRSMGFLWYLGFNVKSAVVNLSQVPMVAYPYLASKYGDARSSAAILGALKTVTGVKLRGKAYPEELGRAIERGVREGFIEESRATELAALGESSTLQRLMAVDTKGRKLADVSYYGAFLFQKAERFNREVTFMAAYSLAKQSGIKSEEEAFKIARKAVQVAMFEYAKWNRPEFMRGKKSVFFLFWQYMQGLSYIAMGGESGGAAMRVWMMLLLAGGLQGLPFAENIFDILDFVGTKSKEKLGMDDPRVDLRNDLRSFANDLTDRPDMVMHGLSRYYGAGPMHLLSMLNIPIPNVDTSGSLSAGRVIPGTDSFFTSGSRNPSTKLLEGMMDAFGPVAGIPYTFLRSALDTNPDQWKVWERAMPSAVKGMSSSIRRGVRGEETFSGGGQLAEFDPQDMEHRAENIAQFLGFATTRVNQRYEVDFAVRNVKEYWAIRRALVMENVAYARMADDPEAYSDSIKAMQRFNSSIPDPALRISVTQLMQSLKQRFRRARLRELGIPNEQLYRQLVLSMRELYPESAVDIL